MQKQTERLRIGEQVAEVTDWLRQTVKAVFGRICSENKRSLICLGSRKKSILSNHFRESLKKWKYFVDSCESGKHNRNYLEKDSFAKYSAYSLNYYSIDYYR